MFHSKSYNPYVPKFHFLLTPDLSIQRTTESIERKAEEERRWQQERERLRQQEEEQRRREAELERQRREASVDVNALDDLFRSGGNGWKSGGDL